MASFKTPQIGQKCACCQARRESPRTVTPCPSPQNPEDSKMVEFTQCVPMLTSRFAPNRRSWFLSFTATRMSALALCYPRRHFVRTARARRTGQPCERCMARRTTRSDQTAQRYVGAFFRVRPVGLIPRGQRTFTTRSVPRTLTSRQASVIRAWLQEATIQELTLAWVEEAYSWRLLVRAVHRLGHKDPSAEPLSEPVRRSEAGRIVRALTPARTRTLAVQPNARPVRQVAAISAIWFTAMSASISSRGVREHRYPAAAAWTSPKSKGLRGGPAPLRSKAQGVSAAI